MTLRPHPPAPAPLAPDFPALTSLRWLAALLVFVYHFPPALEPGVLHAVVHQGHVGVGIFFVLSGFLLTLRYQEAVVAGRVGLREYFVKRVARIVPLYWAVLALTLLLGTGSLAFSGTVAAEWTLTQGFFRQVFREAYVPTSWSLTVEECFYALAPLVFLSIAAAERRRPDRPLRASAAALLAWTLALFAFGGLMLALPHDWRQRAWGFFGDPEFMVRHTLFGRFVDFAAGALAAVAFRHSLGLRRVLLRPGSATALAVAGLGTVVLGQVLMERDGGILGADWAVAWRHSLFVTAGSAVLILALTRRESLAGRVMGIGPLVYLGKVSYALYLIQLTPLGKGLLFPLMPAGPYAYLPVMYLAMNAVAAALYELVERPAHAGVLRLADRLAGVREVVGRRVAPVRPGWAAACVVTGAFAVQMAPALATDVTASDVQEVAEAFGRSLRRPLDARPAGERRVDGFRIPEPWLSGPAEVRRSPPLLVWIDGLPARVLQAGEPLGPEPTASYRSGHRGRFLNLSCPASVTCGEVLVVRDGPGLRLGLAGVRLLRQPAVLLSLVLATVLVFLLARALPGSTLGWTSAALTAVAFWFASEAHQAPWASWVLGVEVALLAALAALRRFRLGRARTAQPTRLLG